MSKFIINRRTLQMESQRPEGLTSRQVLQNIKQMMSIHIRSHKVTDQEINKIINMILAGTRNEMYLIDYKNRDEVARLRPIAHIALRQLSNN